jgi:hypothetical protein
MVFRILQNFSQTQSKKQTNTLFLPHGKKEDRQNYF